MCIVYYSSSKSALLLLAVYIMVHFLQVHITLSSAKGKYGIIHHFMTFLEGLSYLLCAQKGIKLILTITSGYLRLLEPCLYS